MTEDKRSKESVNYRRTMSLSRRCKTCEYSYGPTDARLCKLVRGEIKPVYVCDLWESKK